MLGGGEPVIVDHPLEDGIQRVPPYAYCYYGKWLQGITLTFLDFESAMNVVREKGVSYTPPPEPTEQELAALSVEGW